MKMEELKVAEEKGLQDVHVFEICEYDAVAAYSLEEAIAWYKETTGLTDSDLYKYDDIEEVSLDYKIRNSEEDDELISVREILDIHWNGEPFIVYSSAM